MAKLKWTIEIAVDETWIADGFDMTDERALDMLANDLKWANIGQELGAKVLTRPDDAKVAELQGYKSVEEYLARRKREER